MLNDNVRTTVYVCQELCGSLLPVVVTASGIVYLLSLAVFCVCGFLCGRCTLKHKESRRQNSDTAASCNAETDKVHSPPRYPAPVYEDTKLRLAKVKTDDESPESDSKHHLDDAMPHKSEQKEVYSSSPKHQILAAVYEDVIPSAVCGAGRKKHVVEIELEMKENIAYGPV